MTTIYNWVFALLCVFALFGLASILFMIYMLVIEPIREMACNYKRYKKFYNEHFDDISKQDDEVEEDEFN